MKTDSAGFWMALVFALLFAGSALANPIGRVTALQGHATATAPGANERPLSPGEPVFLNDTLATGPGAKMQLLLVDESIVAMGERSVMVLDEYAYAPLGKKENRSAMSLLKGTLKIISGEITKLNPDRFRVRTPLATVGIRGCHLGFVASDEQVDVYILSLRDNESVVVQSLADSSGNAATPNPSERVISASLRMVSVSRRDGMSERALEMGEIMDFIASVTPAAPADADAPTAPPPNAPNSPSAESSFPDEERADWPAVVVQQSGDGSQGSLTDDMVVEQLTPSPTPPQEPTPRPSPPEPDPAPPAPDPDRFVLRGGGTDWQWGIWETAAGTPLRSEFSGTSMDQSDWSAILSGPTAYNLSGMGTSFALVRHNGVTRTLEGTCNFSINAGGMTPGTPANLYASIDLNNGAGDFLQIGLSGIVSSSDNISVLPAGYSLTVDGQTFDTFTLGNVSGYLVGHPPIELPTGIVGQFAIEHGTDASVWGGFGSDLSP